MTTKGGEIIDMVTFFATAKHTPQNCPMFNAQSRKIYSNWVAKMPETLQKHGVRIVAACTVLSEHSTWFIFEAPSLEALQKVSMEPDFFAVNAVDTMEIKPALSMEEGIKMFQKQSQVVPITA